jgi:hypothetical protein
MNVFISSAYCNKTLQRKKKKNAIIMQLKMLCRKSGHDFLLMLLQGFIWK